MEQPSVPVSSSVTLGLVTTGPGGSSARWASVTTRQGALEGGGDNLRGQVEVVPQVLNALVCKVPANQFSFHRPLAFLKKKKEKGRKFISCKKGKSHDCLGQEVSDVIIMNRRRDFQHSPVIVAPGELLLHIPTGLEASQSLDHLRCLDCNTMMRSL